VAVALAGGAARGAARAAGRSFVEEAPGDVWEIRSSRSEWFGKEHRRRGTVEFEEAATGFHMTWFLRTCDGPRTCARLIHDCEWLSRP
jgi:hypothetical protein